jgi:hypothetical protein
MMRALVLVVVAGSSAALAQGKTLKDKEEIKFNEIERGFTVEMAAGWMPMFVLPGNAIIVDTDMNSSTVGQNIGCKRGPPSLANEAVRAEIGMDIGGRGNDPRSSVPLLVVTAMLQASQVRASNDYLGTSSRADMASKSPCLSTENTSPSGDFAMMAAGLAAKVNIVGFADSQDVKRLWIYARVGGGVNFFFPNTLIKQIDFMLQAGGGIEYYTRLRHFAIGLEANFQMLFVTSAFGVTLTPTLRYSF